MKAVLGMILRAYLWTHDRVHERVLHSLAIRYFDGLHPKNVFNFRSEFFLENLGPTDVVVDIACGSGRMLHDVSGKIKRGVGVDQDGNAVAVARKKFLVPNVEFHHLDLFSAEAAQLARGCTVAIFSHILEHIDDVPTLLRQVGAPRVLICVPSQEHWYSQMLQHLGLPWLTDPTHRREYTRKMLSDELEQAGYRVDWCGFNSLGEIVCSARRV